MDCSVPGTSVHGILRARILEWVDIPFSRGSSQPRDGARSPALQEDSSSSELPGTNIDFSMMENCMHFFTLLLLLLLSRFSHVQLYATP